jgi:methionine-rich copper-binding protein CopC
MRLVDMKRILLLALCLMCIAGTASAYQLYIKCPSDKPTTDTVVELQVGLPLKCSVDSNFPAGTTFDLALYQAQYTATLISKQRVTIQENKNTQYKLFDTQGLPGGTYKIEVQFLGADDGRLSSDSVSLQQVKLIDRSADIEITSPMSQNLEDALRIEGSIRKLGSDGVQIEVRGPDGRIFGPQYIGTTNEIRDGSGKFTKKVAVTSSGSYEVDFSDSKGYIGKVTFTVTAPVTQVATTVPLTTAPVYTTTRIPVTEPTPWPTATQSPVSPLTLLAAAGLAGLVLVFLARKAE